MNKFACLAILMAFGAVMAWAADFTGTWSGQMEGGGPQVSFTFKQDGAKLTGTVTGPQGDPIEISDGKVDGDKVTFTVTVNGIVIEHEGTMTGDAIQLTSKSEQGDFPVGEMTLKRSK